jgi:hypothetical protein
MSGPEALESYDAFVARIPLPGLSYRVQDARASASSSSGSASSAGSAAGSSDCEGSAFSESESEGAGDATSDCESSGSGSGSNSGSKAAVVDEDFADFEDLKRYAEKLAGCRLSNNKRTTTCPPKWMKEKYPEVTVHWTSGTLYCMKQKKDHEANVPWAKTTCRCHFRYVLHASDTWRIQKHCTQHNHELVQDECRRGISGIRHITNASHLEQDQIRTINAWFDLGTGEMGL